MEIVDIKKDLGYMTFKKLDEENVINYFAFKPYNFRRPQVTEDERNEMYKKIHNDLNVTVDKVIRPYQTHTTNVKIVDEKTTNADLNEVDGVVTNVKGIGLSIVSADCQILMFYDKNKGVIGNIHSGWPGTLNRISTNTINLMKEYYGCNVEDIEVFIEPSILQCCFEVDEDLKEKFEDKFQDIDIESCIKKGEIKDNKQKYYIDTVLINKQVLINLGVKEENIYLSDVCSKCNNDYIHSHRGDGVDSGRNLGLICMMK